MGLGGEYEVQRRDTHGLAARVAADGERVRGLVDAELACAGGGAVYIASRSLGKISGSYVSCKATRCSEKIQKYLGITLLPQAGVALGMAAEAAELSDGHMVRNVVLFSVLVYELVGPTLAKLSLTAAGEIIPEGRTSARTTNKPEEPVSVE